MYMYMEEFFLLVLLFYKVPALVWGPAINFTVDIIPVFMVAES